MVVHYFIRTLGCHSNLCITWSCSHPSPSNCCSHLKNNSFVSVLYLHTESDQELEGVNVSHQSLVLQAFIATTIDLLVACFG